jgi:predicted enzyme related to lactoylglutathione lyase
MHGRPHLSLLVLRAQDPTALVAFYSALGLVFVQEQHGEGPVHYAAYADSVVLEIYPKREGASTTAVRLGFRVPGLEGIVAALVTAGGVLRQAPTASRGGRSAVIKDPEGHTVELTESYTV